MKTLYPGSCGMICLSQTPGALYKMRYPSETHLNTLRLRQNGRRFADYTFKRIFLNGNVRISIKISLKFVPKGPINNNPALVQIMAWRRPGNKPLSEPMMVNLLMHVCVTRPQWVKIQIYENLFAPIFLADTQLIWNFVQSMLSAKLQNDWTIETNFMITWDFLRFEIKVSFVRISYIAQLPRPAFFSSWCNPITMYVKSSRFVGYERGLNI